MYFLFLLVEIFMVQFVMLKTVVDEVEGDTILVEVFNFLFSSTALYSDVGVVFTVLQWINNLRKTSTFLLTDSVEER